MMDLIGLIALGIGLAAPLAYGVATLLGMTHKQFRPIFRARRANGTTAPIEADVGQSSGKQS